jgi:hypothetical protein
VIGSWSPIGCGKLHLDCFLLTTLVADVWWSFYWIIYCTWFCHHWVLWCPFDQWRHTILSMMIA